MINRKQASTRSRKRQVKRQEGPRGSRCHAPLALEHGLALGEQAKQVAIPSLTGGSRTELICKVLT